MNESAQTFRDRVRAAPHGSPTTLSVADQALQLPRRRLLPRRTRSGPNMVAGEMPSPKARKRSYAYKNYSLMSEYSVLFISAEVDAADKLVALLRNDQSHTLECTRVDALFDGLRAIQDKPYDLVVSDLYLPDGQGLATLHHLQQHAPKTPVIMLCHAKDRDTAVTAVRKGAHDFFCYEDLDPANFRRSVAGALNSSEHEAAAKREAERRTNARFDCHLAVSYQTLEKPFLSGQGTSETLNISSKGVLFKANEALEPGQLVQVSVDWPARLENQSPLKLVAEGRIVRNINGIAAMTIEKYEFRTRRSPAQTGKQSDSQTR